MRFSSCIGTIGAFPCPTLPPKPADTIIVKCGSAWVSRGKLMKLVWEDPRFWVQAFACLQYFLSADQRSSHPLRDIAYQHRSACHDLTQVERQRIGHQEGWKKMRLLQRPLVCQCPKYRLWRCRLLHPAHDCCEVKGNHFHANWNTKSNELHRGFPRLENTLLTNMSNLRSCSTSHLLHKAVLPCSLCLGR